MVGLGVAVGKPYAHLAGDEAPLTPIVAKHGLRLQASFTVDHEQLHGFHVAYRAPLHLPLVQQIV